MSDSIQELKEKVIAFRDARNWTQFHNPKDLAISIALEAAELLEVFQWSGADVQIGTEKKMNRIKEELADVVIYCTLLADNLNVDISKIVSEKLEQNSKKYPIEKAYGKSDKYTAYIDDGGSVE